MLTALLLATISAAPCSAPEHRQFDFWIGEWVVKKPDGTPAGKNRIERILDGCVLMESWRSASGKSVGHSFNIYSGGKWHQRWVDNQGLLLELVGGVDAKGRMVMKQDVSDKDGKPLTHRITWTPMSGGRVEQRWESSKDGGKSWKNVFVGIYEKKKSKQK